MNTFDPPPVPTREEKLKEVLHSALSELPVVGTLSEFYRQFFGTALATREADWLSKLHEAFLVIDDRTSNYEDAVERPGFITAVIEASRIALGQHLESKLDMLKAVLVSLAESEPDSDSDARAMRYLRWVGELEPVHIAVLRRCQARYSGHPDSDERDQQAIDDYDGLDVASEIGLLVNDLVSLGALLDGNNSVFNMVQSAKKASKVGRSMPELDSELEVTEAGGEFLRWLDVV